MKRVCRSAIDPPLPSLLPPRAPPPTAEFRRDPSLWKLPVGLMTNPDDTNCVPDSRVMPAGLKKIVEASSAAAASPANALPSPRALCSFTWKPAASTLRASHTMLASTTSRQTMRWPGCRLGGRGFVRSGVTARARGVSGACMEPARRAQHADVLGDRRPRIEDGCARDRDRHAGVCEG